MRGSQCDHVRHAIDHHAGDTPADIEDDDHGELVIHRRAKIEFDAHVDDWHDDTAQIDDALDKFGAVGDAGHRIVAAQLLDFLDIDAVFFVTQGKGEKFKNSGGSPGIASGSDILRQIPCELKAAALALLLEVVMIVK